METLQFIGLFIAAVVFMYSVTALNYKFITKRCGPPQNTQHQIEAISISCFAALGEVVVLFIVAGAITLTVTRLL